jgi:hypothetical protein
MPVVRHLCCWPTGKRHWQWPGGNETRQKGSLLINVLPVDQSLRGASDPTKETAVPGSCGRGTVTHRDSQAADYLPSADPPIRRLWLAAAVLRASRVFLGARHETNERRTSAVIGLCGATMLAEIRRPALWLHRSGGRRLHTHTEVASARNDKDVSIGANDIYVGAIEAGEDRRGDNLFYGSDAKPLPR